MSLFSKPRVILWPKSDSIEIFLNQKSNNSLTLKINLWSKCTEAEIQSLTTYLNQNKIDHCQILIPDDVVFTKSFTYDTKIDTIDKNEVISLAESFVHFKINPDYIEYKLLPSDTEGKTIIQANIYEPAKFNLLKANLGQTSLKTYSTTPVSSAIAKIMPAVTEQEYFLLYPLNESESTLILSKQGVVYLTSNFKTSALDVQKIINYSKLYFANTVNKFFYMDNNEPTLIATSDLDKTSLNQTQVATQFKQPSNFPLPVIGLLTDKINKVDIINPSVSETPNNSSPTPPMENKKNILPLIAVFIVAMGITSVVIWYVLSRNNQGTVENPSAGTQPTPTIVEATPTETPTPTIAQISKTLKLQVLNATDINGQAAALKEKLTSLDFTSVTVGNSTETATANVLKLKSAISSTASAYFESKLTGYFDFTTETLPANSTYDAVFVIGTKLGSPSAMTTTSATPTSTKVTPTIEP